MAVERLWITAINLAEAYRTERDIAVAVEPWFAEHRAHAPRITFADIRAIGPLLPAVPRESLHRPALLA